MVGERATAILNKLLYLINSKKVVADVINDKIILLYSKKMQQITLILRPIEFDDVLILQSAKLLVYRTNATAKLVYDAGMLELNYVCDKGSIYGKRKMPNAEIRLTLDTLATMFATPKLLYDYMRTISGFESILPSTIPCRSLW